MKLKKSRRAALLKSFIVAVVGRYLFATTIASGLGSVTHSHRHTVVSSIFGSEAQQRMQGIAYALSPLLQDDPAYGTEGRMWGIDGPELSEADKVASLASLQGATVNHYVLKSREAQFAKEYAQRGFANDRWDQFMGRRECLEICSDYIADFKLPDQYELHHIGPETPTRVLDALEETAAACGVLPPMTPVFFGQMRKAAYFCLEASDGGVAACAGACLRNHHESRFGEASWWGMLATRDQAVVRACRSISVRWPLCT